MSGFRVYGPPLFTAVTAVAFLRLAEPMRYLPLTDFFRNKEGRPVANSSIAKLNPPFLVLRSFPSSRVYLPTRFAALAEAAFCCLHNELTGAQCR